MAQILHFDRSLQFLLVVIEDHRPSDDGRKTFLRSEARFKSLDSFEERAKGVTLKDDDAHSLAEAINASGNQVAFFCGPLNLEEGEIAALGFPKMAVASRQFRVSYRPDAEGSLIVVTAKMKNAPATVRARELNRLFAPSALREALAFIQRKIDDLHDERLVQVPVGATLNYDDVETLFMYAQQ